MGVRDRKFVKENIFPLEINSIFTVNFVINIHL
jgi:hypothetical protein